MLNKFFYFFLFSSLSLLSNAQQSADNISIPKFEKPTFNLGKGPKVYIDQSHNNFHQNQEGLNLLQICWQQMVIKLIVLSILKT
jgi:hypothetical protein